MVAWIAMTVLAYGQAPTLETKNKQVPLTRAKVDARIETPPERRPAEWAPRVEMGIEQHFEPSKRLAKHGGRYRLALSPAAQLRMVVLRCGDGPIENRAPTVQRDERTGDRVLVLDLEPCESSVQIALQQTTRAEFSDGRATITMPRDHIVAMRFASNAALAVQSETHQLEERLSKGERWVNLPGTEPGNPIIAWEVPPAKADRAEPSLAIGGLIGVKRPPERRHWRGPKSPGGLVQLGDSTVLGKLERASLNATLERELAELEACFTPRLKEAPELKGTVIVKVTVASDGSVSKATRKAGTLDDEVVQECVVERFSRLRFAPPGGGGIVIASVPLIFRPHGAE
ncbi:MAG: AgmX/PglI C-terminal domain-containing protein [Myxococcota bacterium]